MKEKLAKDENTLTVSVFLVESCLFLAFVWTCKTKFKEFKFKPIALRKAKIIYNFGLSECNWVKVCSTFSKVFVFSFYFDCR